MSRFTGDDLGVTWGRKTTKSTEVRGHGACAIADKDGLARMAEGLGLPLELIELFIECPLAGFTMYRKGAYEGGSNTLVVLVTKGSAVVEKEMG